MKNYYFASFFNVWKSLGKGKSGIHQNEKRKGRLAWDSSKKGIYIRAIHGELK